MTFLPVEQVRIGKGVEGPRPAMPEQCQNPDCDYLTTDHHHIVRRSHLGGPFNWVEIDGCPRLNIAALCGLCHLELTANRNKIVWDDGWCWDSPGKSLSPRLDVALLPDASVSAAADGSGPLPPKERHVEPEGVETFTSDGHADSSVPPPSELEPGSTCPTCRRRVNHKHTSKSPVSKTISARLPSDEKDGMQTLIADTAEAIGANDLKYPAAKTIEVGMLLIHNYPEEAKGIVEEMKAA